MQGVTRLEKLVIGGIVVIFCTFAMVNPSAQAPPPDPPLMAAAARGDVAIVKWFLDSGVDPDEPNYDESTPLIAAARAQEKDTFDLLLERGANIHHVSRWGKTVLGATVATGSDIWTKYVISRGAANQFRNVSHILLPNTPLGDAAQAGDVKIVRVLCGAGIRPDLTDGEGRKPLALALNAETAELLRSLTVRRKETDRR